MYAPLPDVVGTNTSAADGGVSAPAGGAATTTEAAMAIAPIAAATRRPLDPANLLTKPLRSRAITSSATVAARSVAAGRHRHPSPVQALDRSGRCDDVGEVADHVARQTGELADARVAREAFGLQRYLAGGAVVSKEDRAVRGAASCGVVHPAVGPGHHRADVLVDRGAVGREEDPVVLRRGSGLVEPHRIVGEPARIG